MVAMILKPKDCYYVNDWVSFRVSNFFANCLGPLWQKRPRSLGTLIASMHTTFHMGNNPILSQSNYFEEWYMKDPDRNLTMITLDRDIKKP